jgi:hypothetical protein
MTNFSDDDIPIVWHRLDEVHGTTTTLQNFLDTPQWHVFARTQAYVELSYFLFPAPAGGEKTKLGGELRREEQLISRTEMCKDRVGTVDDLSEGVFQMPFPPISGTTGVAQEQRLGRSDSTSTNSPA